MVNRKSVTITSIFEYTPTAKVNQKKFSATKSIYPNGITVQPAITILTASLKSQGRKAKVIILIEHNHFNTLIIMFSTFALSSPLCL